MLATPSLELGSIFRGQTKRGLRILAASGLWLAVTAGCQSLITPPAPMMPTPALFWHDEVDPFLNVPEDEQSTSLEVLYACDQQPAADPGLERYQKGRRSGVLRVGAATVQLGGERMSWKRLCELAQMKHRPNQLTRKLIGLEEYGVLWTTAPPPGVHIGEEGDFDVSREPGDRFAAEINDRLAKSQRKNVYVYVHGFNTSLAHDLEIAAQFFYYLGRDGVFLSYGWPSQGELIAGYHADKANARFTVRHFRLLLDFLAERTDVERINILAHSAGAPIVVDTLRHLRLIHYRDDLGAMQAQTKIGLVILSAPDGDLDWFVNACLDGWMQVARAVHVYASRADEVLKASGRIYEAPRTGAAVGHLRKRQMEALQALGALSAIDVTPARHYNKLVSGHSYHHLNAWVSSDVLLAMKFGIPPQERGLVRSPDGAFWTFPKDYEERVRQIGQERYQSEGDLDQTVSTSP